MKKPIGSIPHRLYLSELMLLVLLSILATISTESTINTLVNSRTHSNQRRAEPSKAQTNNTESIKKEVKDELNLKTNSSSKLESASKSQASNSTKNIEACPGALPGVRSLLPSALHSTAGVQCSEPGKPSPGKPAGSPMDAKDCICAFNLIEQSIFTQFILPLTSSSSSASQEKKTSYSWNHGDQFTKACTGLPSTVVTNCLNLPNDRKNSSCATVSKTKACGTVGTCTVKIEVKGKEDLSSLPVQTALTDLNFGFQSYAWSCCPLHGFLLAVNDFPGAKAVTDSFSVTGSPSSSGRCN